VFSGSCCYAEEILDKAEVRGAGRIDRKSDSKTLGYCDVRPYEWAVAIIFCDFFRF
jgi:hypothetical protein